MSLNLNVDVNALAKELQTLVNDSKNQEALVSSVVEDTYSKFRSTRNVMVLNLRKYKFSDWTKRPKAAFPDDVFFAKVAHSGIIYGVWAFTWGTFTYSGKNGKGAGKNWGFTGTYELTKETIDGKLRKTLTFKLTKEAKTHKVVKGDTLWNLTDFYGHETIESIRMWSGIPVEQQDMLPINKELTVRDDSMESRGNARTVPEQEQSADGKSLNLL